MRHARSGKLGGLAVRTQTAGTLWSDPAGNRYPTATSLELTGLEHGTE